VYIGSRSEQFSSDAVTVTLEWFLLNSQNYYQLLLSNITVTADPRPNNVMFTGNMSAQLTLSYNTQYNVSVTQHSTCQQLIRTKFLLLNYSKLYTLYIKPIIELVFPAGKCGDPMELTNALYGGPGGRVSRNMAPRDVPVLSRVRVSRNVSSPLLSRIA
jgi:hypothetical protein